MRQLDIRVNRMPLALVCLFGDVEMTTVWPGGSGQLAWTSSGMPPGLAVGGALVEAYYGPDRVWSGPMDEPDPSQDQQTAQGLWRLGDNYAALTSGGIPGKGPDQSIDQAILRGLPWSRPTSLQNTAVDIDTSQGPVSIGALLDAMAETAATRWGVDPDGVVFQKADETAPTYRCQPIDGGLGFAMDNYASTLVGRYLDSSTSSYTTLSVTDPVAVSLHGYREDVVDLTPRGAITAAKANQILTNLLALGASKPQWTQPITFSYGEILNPGGTPVALETVQAGHVLRVPSPSDAPRGQSGVFYVDIPIGQTSLADGTVTVQPLAAATRTYQDFVTASLSKKS